MNASVGSVMIATTLLVSVSWVRATPIDDVDASVVVQSIAVSTEMVFLGLLFEPDADTSFDYASDLHAEDWSSEVGGSLHGNDIDVTYTGSSAAFSSGEISWSSVGTYGADLWNGSGTARFANVTDGPFDVDVDMALTVGALSKHISFSLTGEETSDNTVRFSGSATGSWYDWILNLFRSKPTDQGSKRSPSARAIAKGYEIEGHTGTTVHFNADYQQQQGIANFQGFGGGSISVPEPTTLALMGLGLAGIGYRREKQ